MKELRHYGVETFLARFHNFRDATVQHLEVLTVQEDDVKGSRRDLRIVISSNDYLAQPRDARAEITMEVRAVVEISPIDDISTPRELWTGFSISFITNQVYVAFDTEAHTAQQYRQAEFYAIGEAFYWSAAPSRGRVTRNP